MVLTTGQIAGRDTEDGPCERFALNIGPIQASVPTDKTDDLPPRWPALKQNWGSGDHEWTVLHAETR
jgi:hypothetical protein